jgi:hypothetical protein
MKVSCEIYSRVSGYFRPVSQWNKGKKSEFKDRKTAVIPDVKYSARSRDFNTTIDKGLYEK